METMPIELDAPPKKLSVCKETESALKETLIMLFDGMALYGKKPEQLTNTIRLFKFALADYTNDQIQNAFQIYIKRNKEFPSPADIVNIIDPPKILDRDVYKELCRRRSNGEFMLERETKYIKEYENEYVKKDV